MTTHSDAFQYPREGMMAHIRQRRALISLVKPFNSDDGRLHLVELEYTDSDGAPRDTVIWEREVSARLIPPSALPEIIHHPPMASAEFRALVRASRFSALVPYLSPDDSRTHVELPVASPFHGAVQVEDFQLVPLLKALQMPRVSLLLADDVGLGKTIEAGLILTELLLRRRIRRVLVITPASLRDQWRDEMHDKFSLSFDLVDRQETRGLRKRLGLDANPWRTFPRIITSYHYLRQHEVLQEFLATCTPRHNTAQLPWDLLIVDEAHNLMPAHFGRDSDLCEMLRVLSPLFEHKLFLTATPHNGHTRSFSGLLELLDPVRFSRTPVFTDAERARIDQVVIRRLKREISENDRESGRVPRFADRVLEAVPLFFAAGERSLAKAFGEFHAAVKRVVARSRSRAERAGAFAVEVLQKRLLSCPRTLADSWYRFLDGLADTEAADGRELDAARRAALEDIEDDREREDRVRHAARTAGAWLEPLAEDLRTEIAGVTTALERLGLVSEPDADGGKTISRPKKDARFECLRDTINKYVRQGKGRKAKWLADERLIVFTEYKTTLDYLERRLRAQYKDDGSAIRVLYGGMDPVRRRAIQRAFNDPDDPVRVLVATDTASEGLNLQETAHLLFHYDIPWNPSRIEQRNGRLDRHGQARDVKVFHFTSNDDADLRFLGRVVGKIHQIREDLGTLGELFDAAFQRRFADGEDDEYIVDTLDDAVEHRREQTRFSVDGAQPAVDEAQVRELCAHIDLSPDSLRDTLEIAMGWDFGQPRLEGPDKRGRFRLRQPIPRQWRALVEDSLRLPSRAGSLAGALPGLIFDPALFVENIDDRDVFRPAKDTTLLHLGHPMFRQALATFARLRFSGTDERMPATRWTVRRGPVPRGARALVAITLEELAVNGLREPFHHWVRTLRVPVDEDELLDPEPYVSPGTETALSAATATEPDAIGEDDVAEARDLWQEVRQEVMDVISRRRRSVAKRIGEHLDATREQAIETSQIQFDSRIKEVRALMNSRTIKKIQRQLDKIDAQPSLLPDEQREQQKQRRDLQAELERRQRLDTQLIELLEREKKRVVDRMLPKRFSLDGGGVQVFPLTIEIRLPEVSR